MRKSDLGKISMLVFLLTYTHGGGEVVKEKVEVAMKQLRPELLALNSDIELLETTEFGVVRVTLSGECCSGRLNRLMTIMDIERKLKMKVPGVLIVTES